MSLILICRKILNVSIKPRVSNIISGFKMHTISFPKAPILNKNSASIVTRRTFFKFFKKPKKADLKIIDNISDGYELIHRNTMERYILYTQLGTSIAAAIVFVMVILSYGSPTSQINLFKIETHTPRSTDYEYQIYIAMFFTLIVILQTLVTKMPLRIYYASPMKQYIMILPKNLPFHYHKLTCKIGDVEKLPLTGILPWKDARFRVKDKTEIILVEEHFRRPADLWIMLGVQRDPDSDDKQ